jgi:hypothetical protein
MYIVYACPPQSLLEPIVPPLGRPRWPTRRLSPSGLHALTSLNPTHSTTAVWIGHHPSPSAPAQPRSVHLGRGPIAQRLMGPLLVVEPEVDRQTRFQLGHQLIVFEVDFFLFDAPPQPLHEYVVQRPPPTVPAHLDPGLLQPLGVLARRELRSLVGVENLRPAPR